MYLNDSPHLANLSVFSAKPIASQLSSLLPVVYRASQVALVVKNLFANAGDRRDLDSTPGLGISPGGGHGNLLQHSCLENLMDRGACRLLSIGSHRAGHD